MQRQAYLSLVSEPAASGSCNAIGICGVLADPPAVAKCSGPSGPCRGQAFLQEVADKTHGAGCAGVGPVSGEYDCIPRLGQTGRGAGGADRGLCSARIAMAR